MEKSPISAVSEVATSGDDSGNCRRPAAALSKGEEQASSAIPATFPTRPALERRVRKDIESDERRKIEIVGLRQWADLLCAEDSWQERGRIRW